MSNTKPIAERIADLIRPHIGRPLSDLELTTICVLAYTEGVADGRRADPAIVRIGPAQPPELTT